MRVRIGGLMWVAKPFSALYDFGDEGLGYWRVFFY